MDDQDRADQALQLVRDLQGHFVRGLEKVAGGAGHEVAFEKAEWLRDGGLHGGGDRYFSSGNPIFNRASVNVSHIHYHDLPEKALASATAISTIIHPHNPHSPSVHIHISWTEMKNGAGYWRIMADLNPSIPSAADKETFEKALSQASGGLFDEAVAQGEKYFFIPALNRHRGVAHFYLEGYATDDFARDLSLAREVGLAAMDTYLKILTETIADGEATESELAAQLDYHTLYFFQVLTLDRGTTSGLLVHDQNDLGIMGSLPARIDRSLLATWGEKMESPQNELLDALVIAVPESGEVTDEVRLALASAVRTHYQQHPEALKLQASGNVIPPTVKNHR